MKTGLKIYDKHVAFWGSAFSNFYPCKFELEIWIFFVYHKAARQFSVSVVLLIFNVSTCQNGYLRFHQQDSIVIFFDKLVKDNKLDNLRTLLYKMKI